MIPLCLVALAGCAELPSRREPSAPQIRGQAPVVSTSVNLHASSEPIEWNDRHFRLGCPDVLELRFETKPEWDCISSVDVDGRLPLGPIGKIYAQGQSLQEFQSALASQVGMMPQQILVRLADNRASRVVVLGPERKQMRVLPYRGPEPVIYFLLRSGALKTGYSNPRNISVVRPNVSVGRPAEVFPVDVEAVLIDQDYRTNIPIMPNDQIYIGETRRSSFARLLPNWLKPMYHRIMGLLPPEGWPFIR